ncbi:MFS transporter [[Kitasatospora] papulosa]|uniref:MFS transporter n=1 Tax=[Kitasatospora] papulosa TaxID=1464011 RepID=UPI00369238F8
MSTTAAPAGRPDQAGNGARRWPPAIWTLMVGTFLVRALGFTYPFLPYHLDAQDLNTRAVSTGLAFFGTGWLMGSLLCGWLADKIGHRATLTAALLLAAAGLPLLAQAHTVPAIFAASFIAGTVYDAPRPVVTAAIAHTFSDDGARANANAWRNFSVNCGAAVAGTVGGILADLLGIPALIWINATACALVALLSWRLLPVTANPAHPTASHDRKTVLHDHSLWLLLTASLCALTCAASLFSTMPMLMANDGLTAADYGWAQSANAGAVLLLSPPLNHWLRARANQGRSMTALFAASSLLLGASMGAAAFASTTPGYAAAAALAVPGEVVVFTAASDLLNRISPPSARGLYAGIWGTTLAGAIIVAPALAGWALTHGGDRLAAATLFTVGSFGAALVWPLAMLIRRTSPHRAALGQGTAGRLSFLRR